MYCPVASNAQSLVHKGKIDGREFYLRGYRALCLRHCLIMLGHCLIILGFCLSWIL